MRDIRCRGIPLFALTVLLVTVLVSASAAQQGPVPKGWTRLHWAAWTETGTVKQIEFLLKGGHEINEVTDNDTRLSKTRIEILKTPEEVIAELFDDVKVDDFKFEKTLRYLKIGQTRRI